MAVVHALAYRTNAGWEVSEGGKTFGSTIVYNYKQ